MTLGIGLQQGPRGCFHKRGAPVHSCGAWYPEAQRYRGTSLMRKGLLQGPYRRSLPTCTPVLGHECAGYTADWVTSVMFTDDWVTKFAVHCEVRVLDGPASGEKASKGGPYKYCNPRT